MPFFRNHYYTKNKKKIIAQESCTVNLEMRIYKPIFLTERNVPNT